MPGAVGFIAGGLVRHFADDPIEGVLGQQEEAEGGAIMMAALACPFLTDEQCAANTKFCEPNTTTTGVVCQGNTALRESIQGSVGDYFCREFSEANCPATPSEAMTLMGMDVAPCRLDGNTCKGNN